MIFDREEIAHAKAAKEMIFNFECFPAVTGHATAWAGRAHARLRVDF